MASGSSEITLYGVLVGAILPLLGYILFHWLASYREKDSRLASASSDFRERILKATSLVPPAEQYWDNNVLNEMPKVIEEIKIAVNIYTYFLSDSYKFNFESLFNELKEHAETEIPKALSPANVIYGGGQQTLLVEKKKFYKHIENLFSYAKKT